MLRVGLPIMRMQPERTHAVVVRITAEQPLIAQQFLTADNGALLRIERDVDPILPVAVEGVEEGPRVARGVANHEDAARRRVGGER